MPRNRQDVPREQRVGELVDVARRLFLERGYAATSIADIAREAGLAANSVYWYFPTKDHAFAAVLDRLLSDEVERAPGREDPGSDPVDRLFTLLERLEDYRLLQPVVHERVPHAPAVADFHERAHGFLEQLLSEALEDRLPPGEDRELAAAAVAAALEGALSHAASKYSYVEVVRFVLDRMGATPPGRT
ncbi:MAG TPA: helix-turn-helix domain-containing protein [Actinomycetes bacterium]|jgi:AcrR family transcriptional regulator|nr:helix-turn-helix domain-containing protein [Actinomycetes bacterium]